MSDPIRILSLGAGVQSSCLALKMTKGELPPADHAIFADTMAEPESVYRYLDFLMDTLPFPVHIVSAGDIVNDFLTALRAGKSSSCANPPFMVMNDRIGKEGRLWRECTRDYKVMPIKRLAKKLMKEALRNKIEQLIGISLDEAHRMRTSGVQFIKNVYPLIDLRMNRNDCIQRIKKAGYPDPPKSACWMCPYRSNSSFRSLRKHNPDDWQKAVDFDKEMRAIQATGINGANIYGTLYVHRQCKPLDEVDIDEDTGQLDLFGEDCEGMCGV